MIKDPINPKDFFSFEKRNKLFEKKHKNLFIWDILRFEIYYDILWNNKTSSSHQEKRSPKILILKEIYFFILSLIIDKCTYLFFTASRNRDDQGFFFDQNLEDSLQACPGAICYESYERKAKNRKSDRITVFNPIFVIRYFFKFFYKNHDFKEIVSLVKSEYSESNISESQINDLIICFQIDYKFYRFVFKMKKPRAIFITQNGIQKGLFAAAKSLGIPVIEVQHGIIDEGHISYSYSPDISYTAMQLYLPTYFFSFSDFWTKSIFYPVKQTLAVGNSFFYSTKDKIDNSKNKVGILVASSDVFGSDLKNLVLDFSKFNTQPVYFKLHPNQFFEKEYYVEQFKDCKNVQVITNEKSIYELLEISKAILLIQSTALYEALYLKRIGVIYKRQSYIRHEHVFDKRNVYLVDNAKELSLAIEKEYLEEEASYLSFFDNFDQKRFSEFMSQL